MLHTDREEQSISYLSSLVCSQPVIKTSLLYFPFTLLLLDVYSGSRTAEGRAGASPEMEIAIINACTLLRAKIRTLVSNPSAKLHHCRSELERT